MSLQQKPLTKTRLMQKVMISYKRIGYYCDLLMRQGLIEYDQAKHSYCITPRGLEVLRLAEELAGFLKPVDQIIKRYSFDSHSQLQHYSNRSISKDAGKPVIPDVG
jgi:predicted transcriptional regulator